MSNELKPCPFCGSTNIDCADAGHKTDVWFIQCDDCGATFPHFDSEQEAKDAWDKRANEKSAKWLPTNIPSYFGGIIYKCSECGARDGDHSSILGRYCWRCGAKMNTQ